MDDLTTEIHETIENFRQKGVPRRDEKTGITHHVIKTTDPVTGFISALELPLPDFKAPPAVLEKKLNLAGVAERYNMPQGISHKNLQEYAQVLQHSRMRGDITPEQEVGHQQEVFAALAGRNPQLEKLHFDRNDNAQLYHALLGVASCFNIDDLQFWLGGGNVMTLRQDPTTKDIFNSVNRRAEGSVGWAPAPQTLSKIDSQLQKESKFQSLLHRTLGMD